jgi:hypothetical protein
MQPQSMPTRLADAMHKSSTRINANSVGLARVNQQGTGGLFLLDPR